MACIFLGGGGWWGGVDDGDAAVSFWGWWSLDDWR